MSVEKKPPHPATVVQRKAPHPATVGQGRVPHPATVAQRREAPHAATVMLARTPFRAVVAVSPKLEGEARKSFSAQMMWSNSSSLLKKLGEQKVKEEQKKKDRKLEDFEAQILKQANAILDDKDAWRLSSDELEFVSKAIADVENAKITKGYAHHYTSKLKDCAKGLGRSPHDVLKSRVVRRFSSQITKIGSGSMQTIQERDESTRSVGAMFLVSKGQWFFGESSWSGSYKYDLPDGFWSALSAWKHEEFGLGCVEKHCLIQIYVKHGAHTKKDEDVDPKAVHLDILKLVAGSYSYVMDSKDQDQAACKACQPMLKQYDMNDAATSK